AWSELRRKLPAYAQAQAEAVLQEQVAQGLLHRHPRLTSRGPERYGVAPPDARDYLRPELEAVFKRLTDMGFNRAQLRAGALELLHEEEWASGGEQARSQPGESSGPQGREGTDSGGNQPRAETRPTAPAPSPPEAAGTPQVSPAPSAPPLTSDR